MKIVGVYHRIDGSLGYQNKDGSFVAILKAPNNTLNDVQLHFDDPYAWHEIDKTGKYDWDCKYTLEPSKMESDDMYTYYTFVLKNREQRYRYFFTFKNNDNRTAYGEFGWKEYKKDGMKDKYHPFSFSWHNSSIGKYVGPEEWWVNTSWYQIFPDRFNKSDGELIPTNGQDNILAGGNIKGIIEKLDYIQQLGFNGIYLNPIFKATSNHKYDTEDYFAIDPDFGSMEDFENLISELKQRGMRIMLDGVFNHVGWKFPWWQDVLKNKSKSKYKDHFFIWDVEKVGKPEDFEGTDFFVSGEAKGFETFANTPTMPRLNWNNEEVEKYLLDVTSFWAKKGIDAWRMDVGDEVGFETWRKIKSKFKEVNKEGVILGEVWYDSMLFLMGDQFDSTMNYSFRTNARNYFINNEITTEEFINNYNRDKYKYSWPINRGIFNMVGTHDTDRVFSESKTPEDARLIFAWLILNPGSVSWYYGDEIDLVGLNGEWNRQIFDWNFNHNMKTYQLVRLLMKFRNENINSIQEGIELKKSSNGFKMFLTNGKVIEFDKNNKKLILNGSPVSIN